MRKRPWNLAVRRKFGSDEAEGAVHFRKSLKTTKRPSL